MKIKLTEEESMCLIALGVPKERASAVEQIPDYDNPIFTLTDLLDLLPKEISNRCDLRMTYSSLAKRWFVTYDYYQDSIAEELIDALYDLLCWVIKNGYLKL